MKRFITQKEFNYSTEIFYSLYLYDVILKISPYDWVNRIYDFLNHIGIPLKSVVWWNPEHGGLCSISKYMERGCSTINEDHLITLYSSIVQRYCAECYLRCAYLHSNFLNYDMSTDIEFKIADTALRKVQLSPIQFYEQFMENVCEVLEIPYGIYFWGTYQLQHEKYPKDIFLNDESENLNNWYFNYWNKNLNDTDKRENHTCAPNLHQQGYFRKLYEFNIITDRHLCKKIDGVTLKEWIVNSQENGKLQLLSSNVYSWIIEKNEIQRIQATLAKENLIITDKNFDWNNTQLTNISIS